jgi:hypothetical protein
MTRARGHTRLLSLLAFCLLAFVAELVGRALTAWIDLGRHVRPPGDAGADYYPILLAVVKLGVALLLARLAWRVARAHATALAGHRALGFARLQTVPRPKLRLSPRLWLAFFVVTALFYLVQTEAEHAAAGRWPVFAPWLHSSALPVFAVLAVLLSVLWGCVQRWLADFERYAADIAARACRRADQAASHPRVAAPVLPPRRLFGIAFESRPPPLAA